MWAKVWEENEWVVLQNPFFPAVASQEAALATDGDGALHAACVGESV